MNNYQAQQFWNDVNSIIGFLMPIVFLSFVGVIIKSISVEEPKRIWLVYVTPEGKWGAWDISPRKPTLTLHKEDPKGYLKEWAEHYYLDAEAQVERGRFENYWISEATTRYRAIRNIQVMALPEHHSSSNITTQEAKGTCYEDAWRFLIKQEEGELIHGTVESLGKRIGHAWVELPTGYIWEPQTKGYFSRKGFDIAASPIEEHRYTVEEAAIMVVRVGKHGPWTDEERAKWLPKRSSNITETYPTKADWGLGPLYHGTTISRANEIRVKGLRLSKDGIVWLAYSFEDALGRAKELSSEVGEPPTVLEVNLPESWHLERAEAGVYLSHTPIPLRYISKKTFKEKLAEHHP